MTSYRPAKLPRRVRILGETFAVSMAPQPESDAEQFGDTSAAERRIRIFPYAVTEQMVLRVLLHEELHAALAVSGLTELLTKVGGRDPEEALVTMLETHIMQRLPAWAALLKASRGER